MGRVVYNQFRKRRTQYVLYFVLHLYKLTGLPSFEGVLLFSPTHRDVVAKHVSTNARIVHLVEYLQRFAHLRQGGGKRGEGGRKRHDQNKIRADNDGKNTLCTPPIQRWYSGHTAEVRPVTLAVCLVLRVDSSHAVRQKRYYWTYRSAVARSCHGEKQTCVEPENGHQLV